MIQVGPYSANRRMFTEASARPAYISETRVDIALLVSALFLQRFAVPFAGTNLPLNLIPLVLILVQQFVAGKLLIQFDRFFWFLIAGFLVTCSLLLNFKSTMLTSYGFFIILYSLLTLGRPSTSERYESTLRAFQFLVFIIASLAAVQFVAQFVLDGRQVIMFYGIIPDFLLFPSFEIAGLRSGSEGL